MNLKRVLPANPESIRHASKTISLIARRYSRNFATQPPQRPPSSFTDNLDDGPSFADFLAQPDSIPGSSHLPAWLKRPIPAGGNFAKIKKDLRGLNLHTGMLPL